MLISKAASATATPLENDHKEGKADREKLTTGESEVQKQLSNGKSGSKLSPKHTPGHIQPESKTCRVSPPGRAAGLGIPGRLQ